jgi:nucleoside transporter
MDKKFRLGFMMFLQYAVWGAWWPVFFSYMLNVLKYDAMHSARVFSLIPLATIISPFIGGQLADRYFPTQKVIAILHLLCGVLMIMLSKIVDFQMMFWVMLLYCLLYSPTLALTNSITFHHLTDSERQFGWIRVGGTIGWMIAGYLLSGWRLAAKANGLFAYSGDMLLLSGVLSMIMAFYAFSLPHTPPKKEGGKPWAFLEAIKMLKNSNFALFMGISFVVATELMFYYQLTSPFLESDIIRVDRKYTSAVMTIAQFAEIFVMILLLPYFLPKYGIRKTLTLGILAWPIRYLVFAIGAPKWLVIASLTLHGFCYVFFFTASMIYVDTISPKDIRASAQSLFTLVTIGLGFYLGSNFAGWIQKTFTVGDVVNWRSVFLVPFALTSLCAVIFPFIFKEKLSFGGNRK